MNATRLETTLTVAVMLGAGPALVPLEESRGEVPSEMDERAVESAHRTETSGARTQSVDTLVCQLESPDATERAMAACSLDEMGADAVGRARDRLLELLSDGTEVEGRLCRDRDNRWPEGNRWQQRWEEPSSPGREVAIALEELGASVLDPLMKALQEAGPAGRKNAAFALGLVESSQAVHALLAAVAGDGVSGVRARAAWALGMIEDPGATDALIAALDDEDIEVRKQAMWALGMVVGERGFEGIDRGDLADALRRALERGLREEP